MNETESLWEGFIRVGRMPLDPAARTTCTALRPKAHHAYPGHERVTEPAALPSPRQLSYTGDTSPPANFRRGRDIVMPPAQSFSTVLLCPTASSPRVVGTDCSHRARRGLTRHAGTL